MLQQRLACSTKYRELQCSELCAWAGLRAAKQKKAEHKPVAETFVLINSLQVTINQVTIIAISSR
jgi:hypothetical protein